MIDMQPAPRPETMHHHHVDEFADVGRLRADVDRLGQVVARVYKTLGPNGKTLLDLVTDVAGDVLRQLRIEIDAKFMHQLKETRAWFEEQLGFVEARIRDLPPGRDGQPGCPGPAGRDGAPGQPGKDGLGIDDIQMDFDGERRVTFKFVSGDRVKEFPLIILPSMIDRGVYKSGSWYERGDTVSFGGSIWVAQLKTNEKPGTGTASWRLAVKHGRDGRDGKDGQRGERGPAGPAGKDFRLPGGV